MKSKPTTLSGLSTSDLLLIVSLILMSLIVSSACSSGKKTPPKSQETEFIFTKEGLDGIPIKVEFMKGKEHNHPLMAIWLEDQEGNYLETLYVAKSIGTGIFDHGKINNGSWEPGPVSRTAALPYWWHKWGELPDSEHPVPDAITGPTPQSNFVLSSNVDPSSPKPFMVLLEINQSWDWNEFWSNDKYPDDKDYKTSSQPALVYSVFVDPSKEDTAYIMEIAGHSHYGGKNGLLYEDISSLTTAKNIAGVIRVSAGKNF